MMVYGVGIVGHRIWFVYGGCCCCVGIVCRDQWECDLGFLFGFGNGFVFGYGDAGALVWG